MSKYNVLSVGKPFIDENGKVVISFSEAEVAPAYMGCVEFVIESDDLDTLKNIDTEVLESIIDDLTSLEIVKVIIPVGLEVVLMGDLVKKNINPGLTVEGVILSMFDGRTNLSIQVVQEVKRYFGNKVFATVIPRNVRLAEAPSHGLSICDYDPNSKGGKAYQELASEVLKRTK